MNRFSCDICDTNVNFEDNTVLLSRGEKIADICPRCSSSVQEFIKEQKDQVENIQVPKHDEISDAINLLEDAGYVIYHKSFKRGKK